MDKRPINTTEFEDFVTRSLRIFLENWLEQRSIDQEVFGETMPMLDWLEMFAEFAESEVINPQIAVEAVRV
jgi:hypothetical protein